MFEKQAAELVERLCGDYVEGVDPKQISVSTWNGDATAPRWSEHEREGARKGWKQRQREVSKHVFASGHQFLSQTR
jgi:hypothetical protein